MAKLDSPLYGDDATGTLARVIAYRRTSYIPVCAKIPINSCRPSDRQTQQRQLYKDAIAAWLASPPDVRAFYRLNKPTNLSGFNFFIRLYLSPLFSYFGFAVAGLKTAQLAPGPGQPAEDDYYTNFPTAPDELPSVRQGSDSTQAWLFNRLYDRLTAIEDYIINIIVPSQGG